MANEYFKVCHSVAEPNELKIELAKRYGFKEPIDCHVFKCSVNDVYLISTEDTVYYLRIANNAIMGLNLSDYIEEANIIISLNENGVNTAVPVRCKDGEFVWFINAPEGVRYATLFSEVKNNPTNDNVKIFYNLGQGLAKIHKISDEKGYIVNRAPIDFTQLIEKPLKLIKPYLERKKPDDYAFICDSTSRLREYIAKRLTDDKPYYGFCHGDVHLENVFFQGEIPVFFDFDCMGYGWRSYDIAVHIWNTRWQNAHYKESEEYKAYIDGYNSVRLLSKNEIDCIEAFCAIRSIWAIGLNIRVLEKTAGGIFYIEDVVNHQVGNFYAWFGMVSIIKD